jgi:hypothetical protein
MAKRLTATQRRALAILADSGLNGSGIDGMLAGGFRLLTIARLVREGLATVTPERMRAGGAMIEVVRARITDAGRRALDPRRS